MVKKIFITRVEVEGFKGFQEGKLFIFDEGKNCFVGDNGTGKTSIGEFIAWVFTGKSLFGKSKELSIVNMDSPRADVRVMFKDKNGDIHDIRRKIKNSNTTIEYNFERISQRELEKMIPSDLFLSIFNPVHSITMDKDSLRKQINSLLPSLTKEDILSEMADYERDLLEKESFSVFDTNDYLKEKRQELKEYEEGQVYLEGYMDKLKEKIDIPAPKVFDEKRLDETQFKLNELLKQKPNLHTPQNLLEKKSELEKSIIAIQHQNFDLAFRQSELSKEKEWLTKQMEQEMKKEYVPLNTQDLELNLGALRNDYKHLRDSILEMDKKLKELDSKQIHVHDGDSRPYCKQGISAESVNQLTTELKEQTEKEKAVLLKEKEQESKKLDERAFMIAIKL